MADNLESYFKKHLTDDKPGEDNWNVPSDGVWDSALPKIQKKRGLFIPFKYLYLIGGILAIAALVIIFWPSSEVIEERAKGLKHQLTDQQSEKLADKDATSEAKESPANETKNTLGAKMILDDIQSNQENIVDETVSYIDKRAYRDQQPEVILSNKSTIATDVGKSSIPIINYQQDAAFEGESTLYHTADHTVFNVSRLSSLSILMLSDDNEVADMITPVFSNEILTQSRKEKIKKTPYDNKRKVGLGVYFAPAFTDTYLKGNMASAELKTGNMFLYSSGWGFDIRYFVSNRFTLVAGVEQSTITSWSKSAVDFSYDLSTEHDMGTGEKENTSPVPMPTPFGEIDTEITYRFAGDESIPDGEPMQSVMETHQDVRYLSIPVGIEYNFMKFGHFNWFAEGGLRFNRALKDATTFSSRILHEGHDMDVVEEKIMGHPTYTENYLNFYLGTGINYQFSRSFQINGSARYFNSITKVNMQDDLSTHSRGFSFKIGLSYIF